KAGGTVSSAPAGAAPGAGDPVIASVTSPVAGDVSFTPTPDASEAGFHVLGSGFQISAPSATPSAPLVVTFQIAASLLPAGTTASDVMVFRDGAAVAPCTSSSSTSAAPDPCVLPPEVGGDVITYTVLSSHASSWALGTPASVRLAGADREATAIAVSAASYGPGDAEAVVLARADNYPDALAGAALAAAQNAPVLLTSPSGLDAPVAAELQRVLPAGGTVYLLGGTSALSAGVARDVAGLGYHVTRVAGADRFATAVAVAQAAGSPAGILLTTGDDFPDALAGAAAVGPSRVILLTDGRVMPAVTRAYLDAHPVPVWAIGGPAAAADPSATPLVGADRYATAALVAQDLFSGPAVAGLATGLAFPDALAAGPRLARLGGPLLLTDPATLAPAAAAYLTSTGATLGRLEVYGGPAALSDGVEQAAGALVG
ncbi:MAG TPA: cell wall-binding repeat-containing protein, partial [Acidimicrobiales bacterium]|nr:cell wall-binding repeat-containing protein [Acidimicrobiales bacterium]